LGPPLGGGGGGKYTVYLRLIGKLLGDFLFALINLFHSVLWLRRYERILVGNQHF